jgi:hypothetical protein
MGSWEVGQTSASRDTLIKRGLLSALEHGTVDFAVPQLAAYLGRRHPLAQLDELGNSRDQYGQTDVDVLP